MNTNSSDTQDIHVLEKYCAWLTIPRGKVDADNYRCATRLMFKPNVTISDADAQVLAKVFENWPRFLSRTQWKPKIYLASESNGAASVQVTTMPENLGATFRNTLGSQAQQPARLEQVCDIWRAAFPDAGSREALVVKAKPNAFAVQPHSDAVRAINHSFGGLNALALTSSLDSPTELVTHAGYKALNFAAISKAAYFPSALKLASRLDEFGGMLQSPSDRGLEKRPFNSANSTNVFDSWMDSVFKETTQWSGAGIASASADAPGTANADDLSEPPSIATVWKLLAFTMPDTVETRRALAKKMVVGRRDINALDLHILRIARDVREIAHHGWLLRYFGLVVEFKVPVAGWSTVTQDVPDYVPGAVVTDRATGYPVAGKDAPGFPQQAGVLSLDEKWKRGQRFELMQLEVQSAARKLVQTVMTHNALRDSVASPSEKTYETPAQRSGGLTLVDRNTDRRQGNADTSGVFNITILHAEDITLGIRPDVQTLQPRENAKPVQGPWRSLTGWKIRSAHLKVGLFHGPLMVQHDVTSHLAGVDAGEALLGVSRRLVSGGSESDIGIGAISFEEVFTWDGWSMAVGHPDPGAPNKRPAYSTLKVGSLVVTLEARGDLPPLRVGRGYLFGARAVYVDGGGVSLREAERVYGCNAGGPAVGRPVVGLPGVSGGSAFFPFMRYEPIAPPDIHLAECLDYKHFPQVSSKKVVLASSASRTNVRRSDVRYFVPPALSLEQAIAMGMYDSRERRAQPPQSAFRGICLTPEGRFPNVSNGVVPKDTATPRGSTTGDVGDTIFHASAFAAKPIVPYLPDPWARRLVIGAFRASDGELLSWALHDYYGTSGLQNWPNCKPLRLEIHRAQDRYLSLPQTYGSGAGRVDFKSDGATLHLTVPAGEDLRIHAWHEIDERVLAQSAIVDQMADYLLTSGAQGCCSYLGLTGCANDKQRTRDELIRCLSAWQEMRHNRIRSQISRELARGQTNITSFGMINPSEVLSVVHAVDQPPAPRFLWSGLPSAEVQANALERRVVNLPAGRLRSFEQSVRLIREPGRTDAALAGDLEIDRPTTVRVDFNLAWSDQVDDLSQSGPQWRSKNAIVSLDHIPAALSQLLDSARQTPNSRATPDQAEDNSLVLLAGVRTALKRTTNEDLRGKKLSVAFGDTRARIVDVTAVAQSRFADEFEPQSVPFFSSPGELRQLICPSSASPAIPSIDYVMPQYHWLEDKAGHQAHERIGGCFRVWLNRPWFSSGVEERLAVVCWPGAMFDKTFTKQVLYRAFAEICGVNNDPPPFLESFVTRWGLDPLWQMEGNACVGSVPPEAFRHHICDRQDIVQQSKQEDCFPVLDLRECEAMKPFLTSYEEDAAKISLVLYEPLYDPISRRHYVDIQMEEKYAYYPFVRLALARYQQYALPGFELSEIAVHEFVQLPPTRRTQLDIIGVNIGAHTLDLTITMRGALPAIQLGDTDWNTSVTARLEYLPVEAWRALSPLVPEGLGIHGVAWVPLNQSTVNLQRVKPGQWELPPAKKTFTLEKNRMYSIVIEEFEIGFQDDRDVVADPPGWGNAALFGTPVKRHARRVFSDRLLLPEQS